MHPPFDAASFLSATPDPRQQEDDELGGAGAGAGAASSASPSRGTRAGGENAGTRCQEDCRHPAKASCAHCCSDRGGTVCPSHVKTTSDVPASHSHQCSELQQTLAASASASTAAVGVDVEPSPIPNKRPRRTALPSVAVAAAAATSSVDQPIATTALVERFAREVSLDAVFRRVRLGGGGGGGPEPEVAYYTTVTIAGHVFRGVLYDAGPRSGSSSSSSAADASDTDGSGEVGSSLSTAGGGSCLDLALGL